MKAVRNSKGQLTIASVPVLGPVLMHHAGIKVQRLLGYWALWHAFGGLDGLLASGVIGRAGAYAQRSEFHQVFGVEVENFLPAQAVAFKVLAK